MKIRTKFYRSKKTGVLVSHISEEIVDTLPVDPFHNYFFEGNKVVVVPDQIEVIPKILYDCDVAEMKSGKGYIVKKALKAEDNIQFVPENNHALTIHLNGEKTSIKYDPEIDSNIEQVIQLLKKSSIQTENKKTLIKSFENSCKMLYKEYLKSLKEKCSNEPVKTIKL